MTQSCDCIVLGAGMVGVSTAVHLQKRGKSVVLVDRKPAGEGTSFGNAGLIQAEAYIPYMLPKQPLLLAKMLANLRPEVHVHYRALLALSPWLAKYMWNSRNSAVERAIEAFSPLTQFAVSSHDELAEEAGATALIRRTGYIRVFHDTAALDADEADFKMLAERFGVKYEVINPDKLAEMEPHLSGDLVGALWMREPTSVSDPGGLTKAYARLFTSLGGQFLTADATTLERKGASWRVQTVNGPITAENAIVALGPWSAEILKAQGVTVPLAVKRGYHMHYSTVGNATLNRPVIDVENGYFIGQMQGGIRMTTGAEFAFRDAKPTPKQLEMLEPIARSIFPLDERKDDMPWMGARPCLSDMIPAIGPVPRNRGLWANFGHQHWGLTLGPITGRLLAEMITGEAPTVDPAPYAVSRF
jgi:D-amino-acid dehydrogenase